MKRIVVLLMTLLILLPGCGGYKETSEHELLTIRGGIHRDGNAGTFVEISYRVNDGIETTIISDTKIAVGEESKVVLREGYTYPIVFLTVDDYNEFYGLN